MVTVEYIFREDVEELVRLSYEGDTELFEKYHLKPDMTFEEAVESHLDLFDTVSKEVDLNYYKVLFNGESIGYFATFPKCLYSFAIGMKWRTKDILKEVFSQIKNSFISNEFVCVLYKNNTRAINWLHKCGMVSVENEFGDNSISLINNI